jgi:hypothetical protein
MTVGRNMGGVSNMHNVAETTPYWIFCARVNHCTHVNIYSDILRALVRRWLHSQAKLRENFYPNCFLLLLSYLDHCIPKNELRKCTSYGIIQYTVYLYANSSWRVEGTTKLLELQELTPSTVLRGCADKSLARLGIYSTYTTRSSIHFKSRASPDMLSFSLCNKKILAIRHMNRPLFPKKPSIPPYDSGNRSG